MERYRVTVEFRNRGVKETELMVDTPSVFHLQSKIKSTFLQAYPGQNFTRVVKTVRVTTIKGVDLGDDEKAIVKCCAENGGVHVMDVFYTAALWRLHDSKAIELSPSGGRYVLTPLGREVAAALGMTGGAE